jgi:hypothetical protein
MKKNNCSLKEYSHATGKSEAIAFARRCRSSQLKGWWTRKKIGKMEVRGGGEAQGVADPPKSALNLNTFVPREIFVKLKQHFLGKLKFEQSYA